MVVDAHGLDRAHEDVSVRATGRRHVPTHVPCDCPHGKVLRAHGPAGHPVERVVCRNCRAGDQGRPVSLAQPRDVFPRGVVQIRPRIPQRSYAVVDDVLQRAVFLEPDAPRLQLASAEERRAVRHLERGQVVLCHVAQDLDRVVRPQFLAAHRGAIAVGVEVEPVGQPAFAVKSLHRHVVAVVVAHHEVVARFGEVLPPRRVGIVRCQRAVVTDCVVMELQPVLDVCLDRRHERAGRRAPLPGDANLVPGGNGAGVFARVRDRSSPGASVGIPRFQRVSRAGIDCAAD